MKKETKSKPAQANYVERAAKLKVEAVASEFELANTLHGQFHAHAQGISENTIGAVNVARELGLHIQGICGHKQMDKIFWRTRCAGKLNFTFDQAKGFIAVANKTPEPVKTLGEAVHLIQMCLIADNLLTLPERTESQHAHQFDLLERFVNEFTLIRQQLVKYTRSLPMEKWSKTQLQKFLSETEWFWLEREKADRLAVSMK